MNKKDEFKIDLVSGIDEELVEKVSEKRFLLLERLHARIKKRRVRMISSFVGVAALVACALILALLLPMLSFPGGNGGSGDGTGTGAGTGAGTSAGTSAGTGDGAGTTPGITIPIQPDHRQIPIYQGMSVSNSAPVVSAEAWIESGSFLLSASGDIHGHRPTIDRDKPFGDGKHDVKDAVKESLSLTPSADQRYYAAKHTDIYITVHLSNPDNFEILSFTLNGVKYSDYMFEAGSDLENLILKVNTGDSEGVVRYTIDAIKYVDGTEIKDVRMEGERTVDVVITPEDQPTAAVTLTPAFHSITASVTVTDTEGLISEEDGRSGVFAYLYDGEELIRERRLEVGENTVIFDGLASNTLYELAVVGVYNALDGKGLDMHFLHRDVFYTKAAVLFDDVELSGNRLYFSLHWDEDVTERTLSSLVLYADGKKLRELPPDTTVVEGLEDERSYFLRAEIEIGGVTETITLSFATGKMYPISFVTNGGDAIEPQLLAASDKLPVAVREGYTFFGWYTDAMLSNQITAPPTEEATLYARWSGETKPHLLKYTVSADGVTVTGLADETQQSLHVPTYIGGLPVVAIADEAFDAVPLGRVVLGEYIKSIGRSAFSECRALSSILLPTGLETIGASAFFSCTSLAEIALPAGVTVVGSGAFSGCASLSRVTLPEGITSIESEAFMNCARLESLTLPASLTSIGSDAFLGCAAIQREDGVGYISDWVIDADAEITDAAVKAGTRGIAPAAFMGCAQLKSVVLPEGLLYIGGGAFADCAQLKGVTLPEGLLSIGGSAFENCSALESMVLPKSLTFLASGAFSGAFENGGSFTVPAGCVEAWNLQCLRDTGLTEITILSDLGVYLGLPKTVEKVTIGKKTYLYGGGEQYSDSLTSIREFYAPDMESWIAFHCLQGNKGISILDRANLYIGGHPLGYELIIPEGVTKIPTAIFANCSYIERIVLPSTLEVLEAGTFEGCTNIREIYNCSSLTLDPFEFGADADLEGNPINVPNIYTPTFGESIYAESNGFIFRNNYLIGYQGDETELTLPASKNGSRYSVADTAFCGWSHLTRVTIPANAVTSLGGFQNCTSLEELCVPEGVMIIGNGAFNGCTALKTVTLPDTLSSINTSFQNCTSLESLTIPRSVDWVGDGCFEGCTKLLLHEGGVTYVDTWALKATNDGGVTHLVLRDGTFGISSHFYSGEWAESIEIPDSVREIMTRAFAQGCSLIETVNGVDYVDNWAIRIDHAASGGTLRAGTVGIAYGAWKASGASVTSLVIPDSVKYVDWRAFGDLSTLESITIPQSVVYLGSALFRGTALTYVAYEGTCAEWNAIEVKSDTFGGTEITVIHCSDGDVTLG